MKRILRQLNGNNILNILEINKNESLDIRLQDGTKLCDCPRCSFLKFNFQTALTKSIPEENDNKDALMKKAYVNYQLGNFLQAAELYSQISNWAETEKKYTMLFICKYNLMKLSIFIENHYWKNPVAKEVKEKLQAINLDTFADKVSAEDKELINWLRSGKFYEETLAKLHALSSEIRDNFYLQTDGGFTNNRIIWSVIDEFSKFESFLNDNFIIYDSFAEFFDAFEVFMEPIIASHAIPDSQGSKLHHIDDYLIKNLIYYSKTDDLKKFFRRYNLTEIKYKQTANAGNSFTDVSTNLLDSYTPTKALLQDGDEGSGSYFWTKYSRIFKNIILLFTKIDFSPNVINQFLTKLLEFLSKEDILRDREINLIRVLLWKWRKTIPDEIRQGYAELVLTNSKYHDEDSINTLVSLFEQNNIPLSDDQFNKLIEMHFDTCPVCNTSHEKSNLLYLTRIFSKRQKGILKKKIEEVLKKKFKYDLFYTAVMYGVISHEKYFTKFYKESLPKPNTTSFRNAFIGKDDKRYEGLNHLTNMAFKINVNLNSVMFRKIKAIDPYYEWLLNLDGFDYTKFKPYWVIEYSTDYYRKAFRKSRKLKDALTAYLKKNKNATIYREYFNIYGKDK